MITGFLPDIGDKPGKQYEPTVTNVLRHVLYPEDSAKSSKRKSEKSAFMDFVTRICLVMFGVY